MGPVVEPAAIGMQDRLYNAPVAPSDRKRPYNLASPMPPRYLLSSPMSPTFFAGSYMDKRHKASHPAVKPVKRRTKRRFVFREVDPTEPRPLGRPPKPKPGDQRNANVGKSGIPQRAASILPQKITEQLEERPYPVEHPKSEPVGSFSRYNDNTDASLRFHRIEVAPQVSGELPRAPYANQSWTPVADPETRSIHSLPELQFSGSSEQQRESPHLPQGDFYGSGNRDDELDSLFGSADEASCPGTDRAMPPTAFSQPSSELPSDHGHLLPPNGFQFPETAVSLAKALGNGDHIEAHSCDSAGSDLSPDRAANTDTPSSIVAAMFANPKAWKNALKDSRGLLKCPYKRCRESFKNVATAAVHYDIWPAHRGFAYKCAFKNCPWAYIGFQQNSEVVRHLKASHSSAKKFVCAGCCRGFCRLDGLRRHEKTCAMFASVTVDVEETLRALPELLKKATQARRSTTAAFEYQALLTQRRAELMEQVKESSLDARLPPAAYRRKQRKLAAPQVERNQEEQSKLLIDLFGSIILKPEMDIRDERTARRHPSSMMSAEEDAYIASCIARVDDQVIAARSETNYMSIIGQGIDYSKPPPLLGFEVTIDNTQASWQPLSSGTKPAAKAAVRVFKADKPKTTPIAKKPEADASPAPAPRRRRGRPKKRQGWRRKAA